MKLSKNPQHSLLASTWVIVSKHDFPFPGVGAASSGKLTFMVGGAEEEFTAAKELLSCMGANVVYCGQVGTGQVWADFILSMNYNNAFVIQITFFHKLHV